MCNLIGAKISDLEVDEEILQIYVTCEIFKLIQLIRTENGYVVGKVRKVPKIYNSEVLLDSSNPSKIIIVKEYSCVDIPELQKSLCAWNPVIFKGNVEDYLCDAIKEIVDHIFVIESSKKYFVIPQTFHESDTNVYIENPIFDGIVLSIKHATNLPVTESCIISRFNKKMFVS
uniref:Uncharacterized protein n=1 Tax=Panagrolaimus superbus TaxID=310955 RepID=A0A914Y8A5_9BILA